MHCRFFRIIVHMFFSTSVLLQPILVRTKMSTYFVRLCFSDVRRVAAILSMVQFLALVLCQNTFLYTNTP